MTFVRSLGGVLGVSAAGAALNHAITAQSVHDGAAYSHALATAFGWNALVMIIAASLTQRIAAAASDPSPSKITAIEVSPAAQPWKKPKPPPVACAWLRRQASRTPCQSWAQISASLAAQW
jgi:hypothetical protein